MSQVDEQEMVHLVCFNCFAKREVQRGYLDRLEDTHVSKTQGISTVIHCDHCGYSTFHTTLLG